MKPPVLCITREELDAQNIPKNNAYGIYSFNMSIVNKSSFHFLNREVADRNNDDEYKKVGELLPQILVYCVVKHEGKVLTYSRKKGAESRLHGSRSIGFGGHVDISDYYHSLNNGFINSLAVSAERELREELNYTSTVGSNEFTSLLVDQSNPVGAVHVGIPILRKIHNINEVEVDPEEISDPIWLSPEELLKDIEQYENWSKILINEMYLD
ncbi:hypothetical protein DJ533_00350 (plasmid) [Acinetobacter defluvii]|uniref:Nudix hydrolase domain-containing protein n=1 Tax=Acinetobacter defluvii TaxID=1871111 RepID=A0A2S2F897_9GAMM|nr:hypothetical protein [Acinetobacter defluvii]AWL27169.1 hypothetical protein DJ533_00350 [Acinetobacter defluvii]